MKAKILVSDDEKIWREDILGNLLREAGYAVHTVSTIEKTTEVLQREFFHLVTIDLMFSEDHSIVEGKRTMSLIKQLNEGTKAIVLSGHGTVDLAVEALKEFEVFHFLQKGESFDEEKFLNLVKDAIQEVNVKSINYCLTIPVETVISGYHLQDLASTMGEKKEELRWLILNLINDVLPVNFSEKKGELINTSVGRLFKREIWSRLLGKPMYILFGSAKAMEQYVNTTGTTFKINNTENTVGCLIESKDIIFDNFKTNA